MSIFTDGSLQRLTNWPVFTKHRQTDRQTEIEIEREENQKKIMRRRKERKRKKFERESKKQQKEHTLESL